MGIPGGAIPLLLRRAAAAADDPYEIKRSLRFNPGDTPDLTSYHIYGNRRTYTISVWVKRSRIGEAAQALDVIHVAAGGSEYTDIKFDADDRLRYSTYAGDDGTQAYIRTSAKYRDPTAWLHIVVALDTTHAVNTERLRMWVNGKQITSTSSLTYPAQNNAESYINNGTNPIYIGKGQNASNYFDGYVADAYLIDGLALNPSAFAKYSSSGSWDPIEFKLPARNQGVTQTSALTSSSGAFRTTHAEAAFLFDNRTGYGASTSASSGGTITWTPVTDMPFTQGVRCKAGESGVLFTLTLADGSEHKVQTAASGSGGNWHILYEGAGSIEKITCYAASTYQSWEQIEVDGIWIQDSVSDPTTRNNPNNGTRWSDGGSGSFNSGASPSNALTSAFDGSHATFARPASDATATWTAATSIPFTTLSINAWNDSVSDGIVVNGVNVSSSTSGNTGNDYIDITDVITSPLSTIVLKGVSSSLPTLKAIKVDGQILVDDAIDNSFHLKFEDDSAGRYLGKDTLNGKIADATGGKPILKTTDDYGDVVGSGNATDSNSSNLKVAIPMNGTTGGTTFNDVSGNSHNGTAQGNAQTSTDHSRFYGSSGKFDGTGDYISLGTDTDWSLDGDFTMECWMRLNTNQKGIIASVGDNNTSTGFTFYAAGDSDLRVYGNSEYWFGTGALNGRFADNEWAHFALVRASGVAKIFVNGRDVGKTYSSATTWAGALNIGAELHNGGYDHHDGYLQDFRLYKSVAVYTSDFIAPNRHDFNDTNLTSAAGSVGHTGAWNTGFKKHSRTTWASANAWTPSSGDSFNTNGNNKVLYIDRESLGAAFNITIEDTGGANDIYVTEADDGSSWVNTINNQAKIILTESSSTYISTSGTTSDVTSSIKRYLRLEGAGGGYCTMTVSGTAFGVTGAETDSLLDSPTNVEGTGDDSDGGVNSGNYCTMDPLSQRKSGSGYIDLSQGNLKCENNASAYGAVYGTMAVRGSGKWYFECTIGGSVSAHIGSLGLTPSSSPSLDTNPETATGGYGYGDNGQHWLNGVTDNSTGWNAWAVGDVIGVKLDLDSGTKTVQFLRNNSSEGTLTINDATLDFLPFWRDNTNDSTTTATGEFNFGQRAFKYAQTGFSTWCTFNLPDLFGANNNADEDLNDPSKYFDIAKWTGISGSNQSIINLKFAPDFVWVKDRKDNNSHNLADRVRGANKQVWTNSPGSQYTYTNSINSLDTNGFTVGTNGNVNTNGNPFLAWCWDAGTAAASASTAGSINPTDEWVNTESGFSIIQFTSPDSSSAQTVGHSLGAVPHFIMSKNLENSYGFEVWHRSLAAGKSLQMNDDGAALSGRWGSMTSTTFGTVNSYTHYSTHKYINWLWTEKPGFSSFGSFEGTANNSGPFVYCGFRPHYVLIKNMDASDKWHLYDTARSTHNPSDLVLFPSVTDAGNTYEAPSDSRPIDILANGFKLRHDDDINSAHTFIYCAFAEHPYKTARAR